MTAPRIELPHPGIFHTARTEQAFLARQEAEQQRANDAWAKYPPGTKLHVSARRHARRARGGVTFSDAASIEVHVVDMLGDELATRQRSDAVVSPLGAAAICADDALVVHGGPRTRAMQVAADDELANLRAENAKLRAEAVRSRDAAPNDGRPTRLGKGSGKPDDKARDDFGGEGDKPKA